MTVRFDLSNQRFGRWLVLAYSENGKWRCRCDCGTERPVEANSLRRGRTMGCNACAPNRSNRRTHGQCATRLYNIWCGMKRRCLNPDDAAYPKYGGRGIKVCDAWAESYEAFHAWATTAGYEPNLTIDRENNDGNYEPGNCRWATYAEQNRNYSRNNPVFYQGRHVLIGELAAEHGLPADIVKNRIRRYGWPISKALSDPVATRPPRKAAITFRRIQPASHTPVSSDTPTAEGERA